MPRAILLVLFLGLTNVQANTKFIREIQHSQIAETSAQVLAEIRSTRDLKSTYEFESSDRRYEQFIQTIDGLPVVGSYVRLMSKKDGDSWRLASVQTNFPNSNSVERMSDRDRVGALQRARAYLGLSGLETVYQLENEIRLVDGALRESLSVVFEGQKEKTIIVGRKFIQEKSNHLHQDPDYDGPISMALDQRNLEGHVTGFAVPFDPYYNEAVELPLANVRVVRNDSETAITNAEGFYGFDFFSGSLFVGLDGLWTHVIDEVTPNLEFENHYSGPSNFVFGNGDSGFSSGNSQDPQVTAYYHTNLIYEWLTGLLPPEFTGISFSIPTHVNTSGNCNAHYDRLNPSLHYRAAGGNCIPMAFDTVVYHEYGHFVDHVIGDIPDGALSEGWGDLLASYLSGQPIVAENFKGPGTMFRTTENEYFYPIPGSEFEEIHYLGKAWAGMAWDLRKNFIAQYGPEDGKQRAENLVIPLLMANSADIEGAYLDLILEADDDFNLHNGWPHDDLIKDAGEKHRLYPLWSEDIAYLDSVNPIYFSTGGLSQVQFQGTAGGGQFSGYQMRAGRGPRPTEWLSISSEVSTPVENGFLANWLDPLQLPTGTYVVQLITNAQSLQYQDQLLIGIHQNPPLQLTQDASSQSDPSIDGNRVVWTDQRVAGEGSDIFTCVLSGGACVNEQLTHQSGSSEKNPDISGNLVVWEDTRNDLNPFDGFNLAHIYLHDLSSRIEYQISQNVNFHGSTSPTISGNRIAWMDYTSFFDGEIFYCEYQGSGVCPIQQLTFGPAGTTKVNPRMDGNLLVWGQSEVTISKDIFLHDFSKGVTIQITQANARQHSVDVSGNLIVWLDERHGRDEVYYCIYDPVSSTCPENRLTETDAGERITVRVSGNRIVWHDTRNAMIEYVTNGQSNLDVYACTLDLQTSTCPEEQITTHPKGVFGLDIDGANAVWADLRNINPDIYYYELD